MKINNQTINKLTAQEMNDLGCFSVGIVPLTGEIKLRVKGLSRCDLAGAEGVVFANSNDEVRHELVKMADGGHAYRMWNISTERYEEFVQPMLAVQFIK